MARKTEFEQWFKSLHPVDRMFVNYFIWKALQGIK